MKRGLNNSSSNDQTSSSPNKPSQMSNTNSLPQNISGTVSGLNLPFTNFPNSFFQINPLTGGDQGTFCTGLNFPFQKTSPNFDMNNMTNSLVPGFTQLNVLEQLRLLQQANISSNENANALKRLKELQDLNAYLENLKRDQVKEVFDKKPKGTQSDKTTAKYGSESKDQPMNRSLNVKKDNFVDIGELQKLYNQSQSASSSSSDTARQKKGTWSKEEDDLLRQLVLNVPRRNWGDIATFISGRTAKQCRERWCYNLDPNINRESWTKEEDEIIEKYQAKLGNRWAYIAAKLQGRTENAVKTRFKSMQRAKRKEWSPLEDEKIMFLQKELGSNWQMIAKAFPNRTKNAVKIRFRALNKLKGGSTIESSETNSDCGKTSSVSENDNENSDFVSVDSSVQKQSKRMKFSPSFLKTKTSNLNSEIKSISQLEGEVVSGLLSLSGKNTIGYGMDDGHNQFTTSELEEFLFPFASSLNQNPAFTNFPDQRQIHSLELPVPRTSHPITQIQNELPVPTHNQMSESKRAGNNAGINVNNINLSVNLINNYQPHALRNQSAIPKVKIKQPSLHDDKFSVASSKTNMSKESKSSDSTYRSSEAGHGRRQRAKSAKSNFAATEKSHQTSNRKRKLSSTNSEAKERKTSEAGDIQVPLVTGKKAKKLELANSTPQFMVDEITKARGTGEFTSCELVITLYFAHKYFLDSNTYSKIRTCMNFSRSRASIRRKIEKIVAQETGFNGGLLLNDSVRNQCMEVIKTKFLKLLTELERSELKEEREFAELMKAHVVEDSANQS